MPKLFDTLPVERAAVQAAVAEHWGLTLEAAPIKASQNTTFKATVDATGAPCVVRVTPDPSGEQDARIAQEVAFVTYLKEEAKLDGVCAPIRAKGGQLSLRAGELVIVVLEWAAGAPLNFMEYRWATDASVIAAWGAWMARFHAASRAYAVAHPAEAASFRVWSELHDGLMKDTPLHPDDAALQAAGPSASYGILHSDLNLSNFFVIDGASPPSPSPSLSVFDWDQVALGSWEMDIAQACNAVHMLAEAGSLPAGDPVPQAQPHAFVSTFVAGYESVAGAGAVDAARLQRAIQLRRQFYWAFAERALEEGAPPDMAWFLQYVLQKWKGKVERVEGK